MQTAPITRCWQHLPCLLTQNRNISFGSNTKENFPNKHTLQIFRSSSPGTQLGIPCTPIMPVKSLHALESIVFFYKPHSLTIPHSKNATAHYKWHRFVYNKELLNSQASIASHILKAHLILLRTSELDLDSQMNLSTKANSLLCYLPKRLTTKSSDAQI